MRQQQIQKEINDYAGSDEPLRGREIFSIVFAYYKEWNLQVIDNIKNSVQPLLQAITNNNDRKAADEIKYMMNCETCEIMMTYVVNGLKRQENQEIFIQMIATSCSSKYDVDMCSHLAFTFMNLIFERAFDVMINKDFTCQYIFPLCDSELREDVDIFTELKVDDYIQRVLADKPDFLMENDYLDNLYDEVMSDKKRRRETYNIMQMSDWHVDFRYQEGSSKKCNEEICCQARFSEILSEQDRARKYGELTCDIPYLTADKQLELLSSQIDDKIDIIYWTGDSIGHDLHNVSPDEVAHNIRNLTNLIDKHFPNTAVIPVLGNHDMYPPNIQAFEEISTELINDIGDSWSIFIQDQDSLAKFKEYGYYKISFPQSLQKKSSQKMEIIVLNTQVCYMYNYGILNELSDTALELQWLEQQLIIAEQQDTVVHILGHISPGDYGCIDNWASRYQALVERYQHIIRFSVFGHDHRELFDILRPIDFLETDKGAIHVNYVSGSLGTYMQVNPSVRLYTIDAKTHIPIEMKIYEFNLESANRRSINNIEPEFKVSFDFRKDFEMKDLSPSSWSELAKKFLIDDDLSQKYHKYLWKNGEQSKKNCNFECRRSLYCDSYYALSRDKIRCNGVESFSIIRSLEYLQGLPINPWVTKKHQ